MKIIKINNINYFIDINTGEKIDKYDPNNQALVLVSKLEDGSTITIENSKIHLEYGGYITCEYQGEKSIIDDGYRSLLTKAGYIVLDNFDFDRIENKDTGIMIRSSLMSMVLMTIDDMGFTAVPVGQNCSKVLFETDTHKFSVSIDTVNSIVAKNQERAANNLPFYPFDKSMDKYGTIYLSIFAEKKIGGSEDAKIQKAEEFVSRLLILLNRMVEKEDKKFKFADQQITKKIIAWEGI